jgi:hypothetical protein
LIFIGSRNKPSRIAESEIDLAAGNGEDSWTPAVLARYIIGTDRINAYPEVNADHTRRPDPSELLPVLRRLQSDNAA